MSRGANLAYLNQGSFPRVSGDEPEVEDGGELTTWFSPRERG